MLELSTEACVDLNTSGARHGMGLFETIRLQGGSARWLECHLERLAAGCAFLGMAAPPNVEAVRHFLDTQTDCPGMEWGILRLIALDGTLRVLTQALPVASHAAVVLGRSRETVRYSASPLNRFKTLSYLENLRLAEEASARGCFEVIALNEKGHLSDGGRTSVFAVIEDRVLTPPGLDGALPGVARRLLLKGGVAEEATLHWADLEQADAVFLANALRGVIRVERLEGSTLIYERHPLVEKAVALLT